MALTSAALSAAFAARGDRRRLDDRRRRWLVERERERPVDPSDMTMEDDPWPRWPPWAAIRDDVVGDARRWWAAIRDDVVGDARRPRWLAIRDDVVGMGDGPYAMASRAAVGMAARLEERRLDER